MSASLWFGGAWPELTRTRKDQMEFSSKTIKRVPVKAAEPEVDSLPEAIRKISAGLARLNSTGLNRKAVIVLLRHETGLGIGVIETVFDGLAELARKYTT